jgi:hypothetical protein
MSFFINLWGDGGPNWLVEEKHFYKEQFDSWQTVQSKIPRKSVFDRLKFPNLNSKENKIVPIKTVFERIKAPLNNGSTVKPSFAQLVNGGTKLIGPNANLLVGSNSRSDN